MNRHKSRNQAANGHRRCACRPSSWRHSGRLIGLLVAAALAGTLPAQSPPQAGANAEIDQRLAQIEQVHFGRPWPHSERMIEALQPLLASADVNQLARIDNLRARNRMLAGDFDAAIALLERNLKRATDRAIRMRTLELAGSASLQQQQFARAFEFISRGLELAGSDAGGQAGQTVNTSGLFAQAARMHVEVGEHALALEYAARALTAARQAGDARLQCQAWSALVLAQTASDQIGLAAESSQSMWQSCQQSGDPVLAASAQSMIGWMELSAGEYERAVGWLERAIEALDASAHEPGSKLARLALGEARVARNQHARAIEILQPLQAVFDGPEHTRDRIRLHRLLAESHAARQDYASAMQSLRAADRLQAEADNGDLATKRITYLQLEFENQRRQQELEALRREREMVALRRENQLWRDRLWLTAAGVTATLVVLLLLLFWVFRSDRRRFRSLANADPLTGLYNHSRFHQRVTRQLDQRRGRGLAGTLIAIDIDYFKQINDRHGHQTGDVVLRELAVLLREHFPPPRLVGRVGGEEFAVFLPDENRVQAQQRLTRLRERIAATRFSDKSLEITLSYGIAEARGRAGLEVLRSRADQALYRAKRDGRDRAVDIDDRARGHSPA